jgi:SAM-dependent methyltransferase
LSAGQSDATSTEFPRDLLPLLRCSRDGGLLALGPGPLSGAVGIVDARVRCSTCSTEYRIERGIARLMATTLSPEDQHEIRLRDEGFAGMTAGAFTPPDTGWRSAFSDRIEIPPHLEGLAPLDGRRVLEIGCGDGRFTLLMAQMGAQVLAVDFSINALGALASRLSSGLAPTTFQVPHPRREGDLRASVGLVQADASQFYVAARAFDRALSATPLDSRDERMAMFRVIAEALTDDGRFVGGVEHDDLMRRLLGLPTARRYSPGGIFIEHFDIASLRREAAPYFSRLHIRLIRPRVPFVNRLPLEWRVRVSRAASALPIVRQLSEILLLRAERPLRPPEEGVKRRGSSLVKGLVRWYVRKNGRAPLWDNNEPI